MTLLERAAASVRVRITAVATLFVLVVTAVGGVVIVVVIAHTVSHSLVDSAREDAAAIQAQLRRGVRPAAAATTGRNDVVVQLIDRAGTVVAADRPGLERRPLRRTPGVTESQRVDGLSDRYTIVAIRASGAGEVTLIVVGRSTEQRDETRAETAGVLAIAVPLVAAALAWITWFSVGRALRPVDAMRREADLITAAHLRRRLPQPPGGDEVPRLARTLNEMLDRIDEGQQRQRRFVSDASHELRSPLTVIRQAAEVAAAHPDRYPTERLAAEVLAESSRLEGLVTALLLLARSEAGADGRREEVDVDDLVLTEVARIRDGGPEGVRVDTAGVGPARTLGDRTLLGRVVANLLDNARRHAATRVTVTLAERGANITLTVDDDGAGIPASAREEVFERFVRLDEARARDQGGAGLGLAIVRAIVEGHGGTVRAEEPPGGGARFVVTLPGSAGIQPREDKVEE